VRAFIHCFNDEGGLWHFVALDNECKCTVMFGKAHSMICAPKNVIDETTEKLSRGIPSLYRREK
jgi:hypothetical protein